ncbi:MAG: type II/IV secretion system protein [Phycisphaeraceae bacterium]|nr:type II/IV secretion system protein [Phycisphaeraceae bacterium]MCW5753374.1 type II/IV secretion system protein [Phycisphaeraceae bacterium]
MSIGLLLFEKGLIDRAQLDRAVDEERLTGERLEKVLLRLGAVTRAQVLEAMAEQFHMTVVDLSTAEVDREVLSLLPAKIVTRQMCVPISKRNGTLTVATSDPAGLFELDELRLLTGFTIEVVLADEEELQGFIRTHYGVGSDTLEQMAAGKEFDTSVATDAADADVEQAQEASVIKLVNDLLGEAVVERATDVHIEPYEHDLVVRYRIDGVLQRANVPATINRFGNAIISRLKIMANMNIAEKRKPQDGRITIRHRIEGRVQEFDLRVSIIPMLFGEGVVLRVLSKSAVLLNLEDLGMPADMLSRWDAMINRPHGILLVTGPTGSGKSTTLYSSLNRIVSDEVKVITVEDPVEYHVPGVNQIQVNPKVGLTFAAGLRSVLRHDPDVVMIGEIRDQETAETAVQASLTGHLVFSTLHTNDAAGATTRLLDMGVEPFLVASSVEGVLAQRLVRRICRHCAAPQPVDRADVPADFPFDNATLMRGVGCRECRQTGYRGRIGVFELFAMTDPLRELVMARKNAHEIAARAIADRDLTLLKHDGYAKVRAGSTTISEVLRALTA